MEPQRSPVSTPTPPTRSQPKAKIVLLAGRVRHDDRTGHHDYVAGCRLLAEFLSRRGDVAPVVVENGWPADVSTLDDAAAIVVYDGGGGKQACLRDDARIAAIDRALARGCGLVMLHQCVGFPHDRVELGRRWLGGVYAPGISKRGHWETSHDRFPDHEICRGVAPWRLEDGWLVRLLFHEGMEGITPLVWAAADPSAARSDDAIASWACERPGGGRSFAYTGIDAHPAWSHEGLRRLVANGVLWSAGIEVEAGGADVDIDADALASMLTPRATFRERMVSVARKALAKILGAQKRW